jgi:hypothetical protein
MANKLVNIIITALVFLFTSCEKEEFERRNPMDIENPETGMPVLADGFFVGTHPYIIYHGEVLNQGGLPLLRYGVCYNLSGNPSVAYYTISGSSDGAEFQCTIPVLLQGYTYYFRSFAENAKGISYGNELALNP